MIEKEAVAWLARHGWWDGPAGERLRLLAQLVREENDRQNLIARSTVPEIWTRHIVDSAQLVPLAMADGAAPSSWLDIGSGAGFPGLVVACLGNWPVTLVEPRPLRTEFLSRAAEAMSLAQVTVVTDRVERLSSAAFGVISARAYAALPAIFGSAVHLADEGTVWLLPKGQQAEKELATARTEWQGVFHVEQSVTDASGRIILAREVGPRNRSPARATAHRGRRKQPGR